MNTPYVGARVSGGLAAKPIYGTIVATAPAHDGDDVWHVTWDTEGGPFRYERHFFDDGTILVLDPVEALAPRDLEDRT